MNDRLTYLFNRQRIQESSSDEKQELMKLIADPVNEHDVNELFEIHWNEFELNNGLDSAILQPERGEEILNTLLNEHVRQKGQVKKWFGLSRTNFSTTRIAIAAAVTALALCIYFFKAPSGSGIASQTQYETAAKDIKPGRNGATIILANGKTIQLSEAHGGVVIGDDKLAYTDGSRVTKDAENVLREEQLTATTAKGQSYQFTLSDGTRVWLNADSKISFTQKFINKTRNVILEGEAYFEVAKDKHHPFIVTTKGQQIEVLGTHFNVNSYSDEPGTATTLLEGSVKIKAGNAQKIIKPGEQVLNKSGILSVREIEPDNVVDWKNGDFFLNHIEFKTAMRKIARWYDMEIIYDASVPDNMESGGWISRDKPLSAVLKSIESSGLVKFKVEGRKIYVMR